MENEGDFTFNSFVVKVDANRSGDNAENRIAGEGQFATDDYDQPLFNMKSLFITLGIQAKSQDLCKLNRFQLLI